MASKQLKQRPGTVKRVGEALALFTELEQADAVLVREWPWPWPPQLDLHLLQKLRIAMHGASDCMTACCRMASSLPSQTRCQRWSSQLWRWFCSWSGGEQAVVSCTAAITFAAA